MFWCNFLIGFWYCWWIVELRLAIEKGTLFKRCFEWFLLKLDWGLIIIYNGLLHNFWRLKLWIHRQICQTWWKITYIHFLLRSQLLFAILYIFWIPISQISVGVVFNLNLQKTYIITQRFKIRIWLPRTFIQMIAFPLDQKVQFRFDYFVIYDLFYFVLLLFLVHFLFF